MHNIPTCVFPVYGSFITRGTTVQLFRRLLVCGFSVCKKNLLLPRAMHNFSTQFSTAKFVLLYLLGGGFCPVYTAPIISIFRDKKSIHYMVGFGLEGDLV